MLLGSKKWLSERVEVSTPLHSLTRCKVIFVNNNVVSISIVVLEGVALKKAGLPVYEGNTFHGVSISFDIRTHINSDYS